VSLDNPRNRILLLAIAQALYGSCVIILFATGGLVGLTLATNKSFATLPLTAYVVGSMLATIPVSMLMGRLGRIPVFAAGAATSAVGALISAYAIYQNNFWLFIAGCLLQGTYQATSSFHSFAASEVARPEDKSIAISWVLTGGVLAAIVGTMTAKFSADLFMPFTYAGSYVAASVLACGGLLLFSILKLPKPTQAEIQGPQRSWPELLRQPQLVIAMVAGISSYALMNLMMTAAPVAMEICGFDKSDSFWVIQWHVLAMFVPSFFTGVLIKRYGANLITSLGLGILVAAGATALAGITFTNFAVALVLLGLGWNFGFIGGTTMLTATYRPSERAKVQGANNFAISLMVAIASASSGQMLSHFGWASVALTVVPIAGLMLAVIWVRARRVAV